MSISVDASTVSLDAMIFFFVKSFARLSNKKTHEMSIHTHIYITHMYIIQSIETFIKPVMMHHMDWLDAYADILVNLFGFTVFHQTLLLPWSFWWSAHTSIIEG